MPTEEELKDRLIQKQDRIAAANNRVIEDLETQILHKQGQIDLLVAQLGTSEISQDMQDFITQQAISGANDVNQQQAGELTLVKKENYILRELLEENGIDFNGHLNRLGN